LVRFSLKGLNIFLSYEGKRFIFPEHFDGEEKADQKANQNNQDDFLDTDSFFCSLIIRGRV
jgi:hypothetical protein